MGAKVGILVFLWGGGIIKAYAPEAGALSWLARNIRRSDVRRMVMAGGWTWTNPYPHPTTRSQVEWQEAPCALS